MRAEPTNVRTADGPSEPRSGIRPSDSRPAKPTDSPSCRRDVRTRPSRGGESLQRARTSSTSRLQSTRARKGRSYGPVFTAAGESIEAGNRSQEACQAAFMGRARTPAGGHGKNTPANHVLPLDRRLRCRPHRCPARPSSHGHLAKGMGRTGSPEKTESSRR